MNNILSKIPLRYWNLISILVLIAGLVGGYIVAEPFYKKVKTLNEKYLTDLSAAKKRKSQIDKLKKLQKEYEVKLPDIEKHLNAVFLINEKPEDVAVQIQLIIEQANLGAVNFNMGHTNETPNPTNSTTYTFSGNLDGSYENILQFAQKVGDNKRLLELTNFDVSKNNDGSATAAWTIEARGY